MTKKKVIVFGGTGLLGSSLVPFLQQNGFIIILAGRNPDVGLKINAIDSNEISQLIKEFQPGYIINLVGATNVDACETDVSMAFQTNALIPASISNALNSISGPKPYFVHVSTDQVYSGVGNHIENIVSPINVYGLSKYTGEILIEYTNTVIVRTNFYGKSLCVNRGSFSDWIVNNLKSHRPMNLFENVIFSALHISTLCLFIFKIMNKKIIGVYNVGAKNSISKSDFAFLLGQKLNLSFKNVTVSKFDEKLFKAKRPLNMAMRVDKFEKDACLSCPLIEDEILKTAKEY